ncbi:glycoside hydrolase family 64 protein [Cadophora sp. MPI-SDFR-AT-0126]|nr:glycoside hydrolase family 64 protein [Leotiomycetes sp. MPI-SDFR-AT-0126]
MSTLDDVLSRQKTDNVLYPPTIVSPTTASLKIEAVAESTLTVGLFNSTTSSNVFAYITGLAISNNNCIFLLQADGQTPYYPENPTSNGSALSSDCAIALGAPGTTRNVTIPYIGGGRIWFCVDNKLTFLLNSSPAGPGLVEPSVSNTADPNYHLSWDFCEFTYNSAQLYANITYVDFVCLPISLTLTSTSGATSHVGGLPSSGLETICNGLQSQNTIDNAGWDKLVITNNGTNLRALSPSNGILFNPDLFADYWTSYIDAVWNKYITTPLTIDTQFTWGVATAYTSNDRSLLAFSGIGSFPKPSAQDIFGANSGAFAPQSSNTEQLLNIGARLDAAFNRSTLLVNADQPTREVVSEFYRGEVTNHYARIVHAANVDGRGYCFPYDDVTPEGGEDQSGFVNDGSPASFLVCVGGGNADCLVLTSL